MLIHRLLFVHVPLIRNADTLGPFTTGDPGAERRTASAQTQGRGALQGAPGFRGPVQMKTLTP